MILQRAHWGGSVADPLGQRLDGPPNAAWLLCRPYPELMTVERTADGGGLGAAVATSAPAGGG